MLTNEFIFVIFVALVIFNTEDLAKSNVKVQILSIFLTASSAAAIIFSIPINKIFIFSKIVFISFRSPNLIKS